MLAGANNVLRTSVFGLHLKPLLTVADTDLQIRRSGWGGHPDPEMGGGGAVSKKHFSALRASVWSKI